MTRPVSVIVLALALAVAVVAVALGRAAKVEAADPKKIVYLHIAGVGSNARAWYQSGPPTGTLVQDALDKFAGDGYRFASMAASVGSVQTAATSAANAGPLEPSYVILLER